MRRRTNIPILTRPRLSRLSVPGSGVTIITLLSKGVTFFTSFSAPAPSSRNAKKIVPTGKRLLSMFVNPTVVVIVDALLVRADREVVQEVPGRRGGCLVAEAGKGRKAVVCKRAGSRQARGL